MPNTRDPIGENVSLLYPEDRGKRSARFTNTSIKTPIIKGVLNQLKNWPDDILFGFLAACLILGCLIFLIFVTVAICIPTVLASRAEDLPISDTKSSSNVYFLKLENEHWFTKEFCYIETAARKYPDLHVYMINLMKEEPLLEKVNQSRVNGTRLEFKRKDSDSDYSSISSAEDKMRERLVFGNRNVKSVDVSVDRFFKSSKLSKVVRHLTDEVLEIAAKAQLLWSVPGIILKPNMSCTLENLRDILCKKNKDDCVPDKLATIEPENGIQLTGVPCQAFMGFLMQEISKNDHYERYTLKEAIEKYCPRLGFCPEIRIIKQQSKCPVIDLDCPIVYSTILIKKYLDNENFLS